MHAIDTFLWHQSEEILFWIIINNYDTKDPFLTYYLIDDMF